MYYKLKNLYTKQSIVFSHSVVEWFRQLVLERINSTSLDSADMFWLKEVLKILNYILLEEKL